MTTVALRDVTKVFRDGTLAVDNVSLDIDDGEFMVLLGPSGCGKSTVLRMVAGLEDPTSGAVLLDGELANDLPPRDRRIAMVFQDFALYPHMTVGDNIAFPLRLAGMQPEPRGERVTDVAGALGIGDVLGRRPSQLSGGQRQRVAMGRAIVRRPGLFLMDEPLSNLDSGLRAELRAEISGLTPVALDTPGAVLRGRIRYLEHHGHESLAFLHIGATAIVLDEAGGPAEPPTTQRGLRRLGHAVQRLTGRAAQEAAPAPATGTRTSILNDPGRHHRRPAELAVRLAPYPGVSAGHPLAVAVRMDALHFFDERGDRIDVGWR
ncbi:ABC transporter ATP-binding protein [Micromonospora sp. KLBMP9576]|uniref:ABC transporter ATP-binding protein n=1 Tax=Micromonospora sp. KLBMP9576 TaxID=3424769 RepID=UPI003D8F97DC